MAELDGSLDATATADEVTFALTVHNAGTTPVRVTYRSGRSVEVVVRDAAGDETWRWSEGRMFTQALREETIEPGERLTHRVSWDAPEPGEYRARASLAGEPSVEAEAAFSVP